MLRSIARAALLGVLVLASPLRAEVVSFSDFSGGLNTRNSGVLLKENESPALLNVVLDKNGGISRREGTTQINATAIGDGSSDANAVYQLETSAGNKYCVSFSSTSGYYSTDGCATNTVFVSTLTRNNDVNCGAYADKLYCVNDQYNFSFNGTHDVTVSGMPTDLDYIHVFRNRCFGAGKDTNPSRLYWSNLGDCETWTTATDYVDVDIEDGDVITAVGPELYNFLVIKKNFSTYMLQFDNANTANRKLVNISRTTGGKGQRSGANFDNRQFFLSVGPNGGQPGVYVTDGLKIEEDSAKLRGSIDTLANLFATTGRELIDTRSDYAAGTYDSKALSPDRETGFMQSSHTTITDTSSYDWGLGTLVDLSTTDVSGSLTLSSDTFKDDQCNGGSTISSQWSESAGDPANCAGNMMVGSFGMFATSLVSTGSWSWNSYFTGASNQQTVYFMITGTTTTPVGYYALLTSNASNQQVNIKIYKTSSGTALFESDAFTNAGVWSINITRDQVGVFQISSNTTNIGSFTDTSFTASSLVYIYTPHAANYIGAFNFYGYKSAGTFTSQIFDPVISTPTWGLFAVNMTSSAANTITFETQASTASDGGGFQALVSQTQDVEIAAQKVRYLRYKATFGTTVSTTTPTLNSVTMTVASTGTWQSPELFLSNSINAPWGTFSTEQTVTGSEASIYYCMRIGTTLGSADDSPCITVTPGSAIAYSTGAYVIVYSSFTIGVATETAKVDSIAINWNEGATARSATMSVYRNRLHLCGQSNLGTFNDVCYVRDLNGAWTQWNGINARHLNPVGQSFLAAGSSTTSGGFIFKLYDTDSDNGAAINSYWESRDHSLGKIQNIKSVDRLYLLGSNDATTLTATVKADGGSRNAAYDISLSSGIGYKLAQQVIMRGAGQGINGNTFRVRFENNAASKPWSVFSYGLLSREIGLMP